MNTKLKLLSYINRLTIRKQIKYLMTQRQPCSKQNFSKHDLYCNTLSVNYVSVYDDSHTTSPTTHGWHP